MSTLEQSRTAIPSGTWRADPVHSSIGFAVRHMAVGKFVGSFGTFDATLAASEDETRLEGTVRVDSVRVEDENLATHLLSPEFFDAERHPELRFVSTDLRRTGDQLEAEGELTIRGVTLPVVLTGTIAGPANDAYGRERVGLDLNAQVDRTAFGVSWNAPLPGGGVAVENEVTLTGRLSLVKD